MKDVFGNELRVGDEVAFTEPGYTYELKVGTIIKFTPKKMLIGWHDRSASPGAGTKTKTYKFPEQVAKNVAGGLTIKTYGAKEQ